MINQTCRWREEKCEKPTAPYTDVDSVQRSGRYCEEHGKVSVDRKKLLYFSTFVRTMTKAASYE